MSKDELFQSTLKEIFAEDKVDYVIETGTWLGTGSTQTLARAFPAHRPPKAYYTIEGNLTFHSIARINLLKWSFVKPLWGDTVAKEKALHFIKHDEALHNHEQYADVFIDTLEDPVNFYTNEVEGKLGKNWVISLVDWFGETFLNRKENLLQTLLLQHRNDRPLVLLDSAGGIGWLEYQTVRDTLSNRPYWLILDDIHHLKHFRSFEDVRTRADFRIIAHSLADGWMIAEHLA
ncbi:hypothetical protein [Spirosoma utsteinense]|uniref:Methyltransferase n=1 Tax=Spirosoma utsteinense TaxID=2585773 RepID=A0ABR6W0M2_9BACT|nr:hypothetical protein [Spirosoma utsteinense]MBC3783788.1 hypothetical protein [Spirosoma utsteinense]MBC3790068.1 hypothetical protein [Spirosoma utsteinense]